MMLDSVVGMVDWFLSSFTTKGLAFLVLLLGVHMTRTNIRLQKIEAALRLKSESE